MSRTISPPVINPDGVSVKGCSTIYAPAGQAGEYAPLATNPYRGCGHGCAYCLAPDTIIQMADGTAKTLSDVQIGDELIGVHDRGPGNWRHSFTRSRVLNKIATFKPAFRVTLEDGHEAICSGDHRWLTDRGWKYTTGAMFGAEQRPYLTTQNEIRTLSRPALTPLASDLYKRGYLAGMIVGDGTLKRYDYSGKFQRTTRQAPQATDIQHHFRLALKDPEGLDRAAAYLQSFGISTHRVAFAEAVGSRAPMQAIRNHSRDAFEAITNLLRPICDPEWDRGWLAGIFDAEGGTSSGVLRIHNTDAEVLDRTELALSRLGFNAVRDIPRDNGCAAVRLLGGLGQTVRFFNITAPAIFRKFPVTGAALRGNSRVASIDPLGIEIEMLDITTSSENFIANGMVSHNCYVPKVLRMERPDFDAAAFSRPNFLEALTADAIKYRRAGITGTQVMLSFTTDPYNPFNTSLTRRTLEILQDHGFGICTLTKGGMRATVDIDLFRPGRDAFASTMTSLDDRFSKKWERNAAMPMDRMQALAMFHERGVFTWVSLEPTIDIEASLEIVEATHPFVDLYKVGRVNYLPMTKTTDWRDYTLRMIDKLQALGKAHYIKKDLQGYLPPGYHNPLRVPQHH